MAKPAPAAASAKTVGDGTNRLRMTRTATLFTLTTLLYFGSIIFYGASRATTPAERYVTGGDALYVEVAGCDVRVESGSRNEVDVERWIWHWAEVRWFYRSGGAKVWKVIVRNVVGCHNAPFFECDETCEVRVRVADDSARLVVRQGASDPRKSGSTARRGWGELFKPRRRPRRRSSATCSGSSRRSTATTRAA